MALRIERVGYALGARVTGIDLREPPDASLMSQIRAAWLEHLVLYFPGQDLTSAQFLAFARGFGSLFDNSTKTYAIDRAFAELTILNNRPTNGEPWTGYRNGEQWHSDLSETPHPTSASLLLCKERPNVGGDTSFANQYLAYETLSLGMRSMLERMEGIHDKSKAKGAQRRSAEVLAEIQKLKPPFVQPAVRRHPETGRSSLFLHERVSRFKDFTFEESRPLLESLIRHAIQDEFVYRHRWTVGDLAVWDNRCLLHKALGDYDMWNQPREMLRTSVLGERSGYAFAGDAVEPSESPAPEVVSASR